MQFNLEDRRTTDRLSAVVDAALELAEECGWRYALTYLISEHVPAEIIQRLLFGRSRLRRMPKGQLEAFYHKGINWTGRNTDEMFRLFDSLRKRGQTELCTKSPPPMASRSSILVVEPD